LSVLIFRDWKQSTNYWMTCPVSYVFQSIISAFSLHILLCAVYLSVKNWHAGIWEADTIPTDSVPTDAIPTVHSQYIFKGSPATLTHLNLQLLELTLTRLHTHHYPALIITGPWCQCQLYNLGLPEIYSEIFLEKLCNILSTHYCTAPNFPDWFSVFPIGTARITSTAATRRPNCAVWTVGIASVGTESVGIAWCTPGI